MKIEDFEIVNKEKWDRALHGALGSKGQLVGGTGDGASDMEKLVAYDRIGGLIRKGGRKVKMGAFYDFKEKKARETPEVEFVFTIDGEEVTIAEDEEVPIEVRAAEKKKNKTVDIVSTGAKRGRPRKIEKTDGGTEKREEIEVGRDENINADDEE